MKNVEIFYPLSPMQEGILFESLVANAPGTYLVQHRLEVTGAVEASALAAAWSTLVERHAVLRTAFVWEKLQEPIQVVSRAVPFELAQDDWSRETEKRRAAKLARFLAADRQQAFPLDRPPLLRAALLKLAKDSHVLVITFHHLILDGWSVGVLLQELFAAYQAIVAGSQPQLPAPPPFRDYIAWLRKQDEAEARRFWTAELAGLSEPTALPAPPERAPGGDEPSGFATLSDGLDGAGYEAIRGYGRRAGLTLATLVQAAWGAVLGRHSGQPEVLFGSAVLGRPDDLPGAESMVGLFINTVPVRVSLRGDRPLAATLDDLQTRHLEARRLAYCPLPQIQGWSQVPQRLPLFETFLNFEALPAGSRTAAVAGASPGAGPAIARIESAEQPGVPLLISVQPGAERLGLQAMFDRRRLAATMVAALLGHLRTALVSLVDGSSPSLAALPLLSAAERHQLLWAWNDTGLCGPPAALVPARFEAVARAQPDAIAVVSGDELRSYGAALSWVLQLAGTLRARALGAEATVAVALERSVELPLALLAVHAAGAAYVPLDPHHPAERRQLILGGSGARLLLAEPGHGLVPPPGVEVLEPRRHGEGQGLARAVEVERLQLAYAIFTSGSTGVPKGVMVSHHALATFLVAVNEVARVHREDRVLAVTTAAFDIAAVELLLPLVNGACVVLARSAEAAAGSLLLAMLQRERASLLQGTPATFHLLLAAGWAGEPPLRCLCGGEAVPLPLVRELCRRSATVWNIYGPTETTVWSTAFRLRGEPTVVPIGHAVAGTRVHLLAADGRLAPVGTPAEVWIAGEGVARGYLRRPALTAERFVPDPFAWQPGDRAYRAGDLARRLPSGAIEFLGRRDHQVKLRGFRLELGEIEAVAARLPGLGRAVAHLEAAGSEEARLVLYFTAAGDAIEPAALREHLARQLPAHAVPAVLMPLAELPLNASGKVDRLRLPAAGEQPRAAGRAGPPRDELEARLVRVWEATLRTQPIGVHDDFFDLGGHSLLAVRLASLAGKELGREVSPTLLLGAGRTVAGLAAALRQPAPAAPPGSPLVVMQEGDGRPAFYCVHAIGGTVFGYQPLVERLRPEQPFVALEAAGLAAIADGTHEPLEAMAERYVAAVRRRQPEGPYFLGGHSFGGYVAFEMAQQLVAAGADVPLVALLDCPAGVVDRATLAADYGPVIVAAVRDYGRQVGVEVSLEPSELAGLDRAAQAETVLAALRRAGGLSGPVEASTLRRLIDGHQARLAALAEWQPRPYPGRLVVLRANPEPGLLASLPPALRALRLDPSLGWDAFAGAGVEVHEVPGHHGDMLVLPHVEHVARELQSAIDAAAGPALGPFVASHAATTQSDDRGDQQRCES